MRASNPNRFALAVVAALAGLAGCNDRDSLIVVDVESSSQVGHVASAHARATAGGRTVEFDVGGGKALATPVTFGIDLPHALHGAISVHVELRDVQGGTLGQGDGSGTIVVGGRADVHVTLAGVVTVPSGDDGGLPVAPSARLALDNDRNDFGNVTIHKQSLPVTLTVTNVGDAPSGALTLSTMLQSGAQADELAITSDCADALAPKARCTVTATFAPTTAGAKDATFTVGDGVASVSGEVLGKGLTPGALAITPDKDSCGATPLGTTSTKSAYFMVTNNGQSATAHDLFVQLSDNQFTVSGCSGPLGGGNSCTLTVTFTPKMRGDFVRSLSVGDGLGDQSAATASVEGIGQAPANVGLVTGGPYTFSDTARGATSSDTATFTFVNGGDLPTGVLSATVDDPKSFTVVAASSSCIGKPLAPTVPGTTPTCTVAVQFTPTATGAHTGKLTLSDPSGPRTAALSLSGKATPGWTRECCGTAGTLNSVWATSDGNYVVAVGTGATLLVRNPGDGSWKAGGALGLNTTSDLTLIAGSSQSDLWIVDADQSLWHQDVGWGLVDSKIGGGLSVIGANDVWWTKDSSDDSTTSAYHYTGAATPLSEPSANGCGALLFGTSDANLYCTGTYQACTGGKPPTCRNYRGVWLRGADASWANQWSFSLLIYGSVIKSIWGPASNDIYMSGPDVVRHFDGTGWAQIDDSGQIPINGIWSSGKDVYFVGPKGIAQGNGVVWQPSIAPNGFVGQAVYGSAQTGEVYAVGSDATGMAVYHRY
jgi:hypothetical protein